MRQILLQNATTVLLQNATEGFYKMRQVFYYKMRQFYYKMQWLLEITTILLQNATFITNCASNLLLFQLSLRYEVVLRYIFYASTHSNTQIVL